MKKKYAIIAAICLLSLGLTAQSVITYNGNAPQTGEEYNYAGTNGSFDPSPSGAGQNWDFSGITPMFSQTVISVTPESTPFADVFPEATIAFHAPGDNESYNYSQVSTSELRNVGMGFNPGNENGFIIHYTDAVKLMQYPFSFNDSYSDSYFAAYSITEGMETHEWGNITVTADAWGSVSTPANTYDNTLRVKSEYTYIDSVWVSGIFLYANTYTQTHYEWYNATSHTPVMSVNITEDGTTVGYRTEPVTGIEEGLFDVQINVYPNPAADRIYVELPEGSKENTNMYIFSLEGKLVAQLKNTGSDRFSADISTLAPGEYMILIKISATKYTTAKFIKTETYR